MNKSRSNEALYDKYVYHKDWSRFIEDYPSSVYLNSPTGHNYAHILYMYVLASKQKGYYCTSCDTFVIGDNMTDPPLDDGHPKEDRIPLSEFLITNFITSGDSFVDWLKDNRREQERDPKSPTEKNADNACFELPGVNRHHHSYRGVCPIISLNITEDSDALAAKLKEMYLSIAARDRRISKLKCMLCITENELEKKGDMSQRSDLIYALSHT